ncbi:Unknown protein sequence [Pseudomonas syringae pv. cilantro]|uniref:Uncharacterized protein n=1 Tax=Pseudomonas syringae pv. cilantro TaxID=81035 RepID=A0A0N1JP42_PSESX|nr:Unknown protein sequence [Pseudomonas syringae pv. cilantro]
MLMRMLVKTVLGSIQEAAMSGRLLPTGMKKPAQGRSIH